MHQSRLISVFVADDHSLIREGLVELLERDPDIAVVGTSGNGLDALQRIVAMRPAVAVLDISMEGMNGIEVARHLTAQQVPVAVVILSMHSSAQYVLSALEAGAKAYLQKESAASEIVTAIKAVHAGRRYLSARIAGVVAEHVGEPRAQSPLKSLSRRELQILQLVAEGQSSAQIGRTLKLSSKTVDTYRSRLMRKLDVSDVVSLVKFAIQHGLITL